MWEHSYWTDYDNQVSGYVDNFWKVVNWAEVKKNYLTGEYLRKQAEAEQAKDSQI
jgi:superoxide dismutase